MTSGAVWALSDSQLSDRLREVFAGEQRLAAERLELIAEADGRDVGRRVYGCTSTAAWLRQWLLVTEWSARKMIALARTLADSAELTGKALAAGDINEAQATSIADSLTRLAHDVDAETIGRAEQVLLEQAKTLEPKELAACGERVLEHIAPELAEAKLAKDLAQAEARAAQDRTLSLNPDGGGRTRITGWLTTEGAAVVGAALDPLCAPIAHDDRSAGQRRADALTEVCRRTLASGELPDNGGAAAQVAVMIRYEELVGRVGAGMLDTGQILSPDVVRRLACNAGILPVVLGGQGQVLDVGRERRLFTGAIRKAIVLRDLGCSFPGCDRPSRWCDVHHVQHWVDGGLTCVDNGVLVCGFHHRLIHRSEWQVRLAADRLPEFIPPFWVDPQQQPMRNQYHRRV